MRFCAQFCIKSASAHMLLCDTLTALVKVWKFGFIHI